ncbi:hypothetical protein K438DRAFT_1999856 [Mycena galopus ATCC 62051]|nr:hypothetical protein K438DRAFT_1999856 [Mycena galopus ATCC 62051]
MAVSTPATLPSYEENTTKPRCEDSDIAGFLDIPPSDSLVSLASQYHSALSSPVPCETSESSTERDLISFSSGNLARFATSSEPLIFPTSPPFAIPFKQPTSPEFSSNRHKLEPLRKPELANDTDESGKTPNVYINGLPPHFRDDQLRAIAAPFGEIISVRCFTRNTGKSPSGYGFVLFTTVAAAEKCIVTLKRSDLHPSFSKVNKPLRPAPSSPSLPTQSSSSSVGSSQYSPDSSELNFKTKMAQLEDKNSSNVYIEGLPMSADKNTLMELVYPYVIQSTRFIRSKLPQSETMIAFMRMGTRAEAEAVILHLNGKMVRGWDGAENRVYLRIADTLDQRELRRSEASSREDEPGRMTIAQATLLNYRAKELQNRDKPLPGVEVPNKRAEPRFPDPLATTVHQLLTGNPGARARIPPPISQCVPDVLPHPLAANIHNLLAINPAQNYRPTPFPKDPLYSPYTFLPPPQPTANMHPNVAALFNSLTAMQQRGPPLAPAYPLPPMAGFPNHFNMNTNIKPPVQSLKPNFGQGGFLRTPAENFTMQARTELQSLGTNPMPNVRPPVAPPVVNRNMNPTYIRQPASQFSAPIAIEKSPQRGAALRAASNARRTALPPSFNPSSTSIAPPLNLVDTALPPSPAGPPSRTPATQVPKPSIDILQGMNNTGRARQLSFTFPSSHTRASTAPVVLRQHNNGIGDNNALIPAARERIATNTNTNMNTNARQNQYQNLPTNPGFGVPDTRSPTPTSTRVFLGPQNLMHLPLLRFA